MGIKNLKDRLFPTLGKKVFAIICTGFIVGIAAYVIYVSMMTSYLSENPSTCVNCHIMGPYYASWNHSSHQRIATCNDCHVPHTSTTRKFYFKAKDGMRHATIFVFRNEPQVISASNASSGVIMENCVRCHTQLNQEFVKTGMISYSDVIKGKGKACWDCHRNVPHGGKNSLSSTPNATVPYPSGIIPSWLKEKLRNK